MSAPELSSEVVATWDEIATFWDDGIGRDGNKYWRRLQEPSLARLVGDKLSAASVTGTPCRALDLATGNGLVARWLAAKGADVLATDGADAMLEIAKGYVKKAEMEGMKMKMRFRKVDVTSDEDFAKLVEDEKKNNANAGFDIIVINMAIMDIATIEPLAKALPKLLAKGGVFVASMLHPVFMTNNASRNIEIAFDPETGDTKVIRTKVIKDYLSIPPFMGWALPNQPRKQYYFHRPMCELFTNFFKTGLVMDAMEELAFTEEDAETDRLHSTTNFTQLPVILAWRMRLAAN